jgi:hypothetical protein
MVNDPLMTPVIQCVRIEREDAFTPSRPDRRKRSVSRPAQATVRVVSAGCQFKKRRQLQERFPLICETALSAMARSHAVFSL